jgi:hypothetical protein
MVRRHDARHRGRLVLGGSLTAVLVALVATGCSSPAGSSALSVSHQFYAAVRAGDGARACRLLAPQTRLELESSARMPCAEAVVREHIPAVSGRGRLQRFGNQAQVRLVGDTAFLAEFGGGWKIVALACTRRGELPFDCQVKGS